MQLVNLSAFDLNLLLVFDALMRERSVTGAGASIGLSQPAVSHALSRLRHLLGDELFVRIPAGMAPTPRAELMAAPLANALSELKLALEPVAFDPATSDGRFRLALNNYAAVLIGPPLADAVLRAAPAVRLELRPRGTLDLVEQLDRGDLDLALGLIESPAERFVTAPLLEDEIVMVMQKGHPAGRRLLSPAEFAALGQLEITSSLDDTDFIDRWLADQGLARRIAMRAPFISAPQILVRSHLIGNVSRRIGQHLASHYPLEIHEPPYRSPLVQLTALWQRRLDGHPAHQWLRRLVFAVAEDLR
jgi:DNA-binding transcriptional LysR family regulator